MDFLFIAYFWVTIIFYFSDFTSFYAPLFNLKVGEPGSELVYVLIENLLLLLNFSANIFDSVKCHCKQIQIFEHDANSARYRHAININFFSYHFLIFSSLYLTNWFEFFMESILLHLFCHILLATEEWSHQYVQI